MAATRFLEHDDLWRIRVPQDPQLSPDGCHVLYVVKQADRETDGYSSTIWLAAADGSGEPSQLTWGPADSSPRWSPDGGTIAFLSKRADAERPQIYLLPFGGGEARRLTDLALGAGVPVWSADGARIAFAAGVDLNGPPVDDKEASARLNAPLVIDRLGYKADGVGLIRSLRQHLHVIDVVGGSLFQLTWGDWSVSAPTWSPDGETIVVTGSRSADRDLHPGSRLWAISSESGGAPLPLTPESAYAGPAIFTPDGATVVYVGRTDTEVGNDHVLTIPAAGGAPISLTARLDRNVMPGSTGYPGGPLQVTADGRVVFCARDRGCTHVYVTELGGAAEPRKVLGDAGTSVSGLSVAANCGMTLATIVAHGTNSGEVNVLADGSSEPVALTDLFAESLPEVELFEPQDRVFTAPDGTEIHGWVVRDPNAPQGPLLLDVHGGPHNAWTPVFTNAHHYHQTLAAEGWTVLYVNPRGSDGYGEKFMRAVVGGWGTSDTDDFLSAIDVLIDEGLADASQLAVTGYSYGGYMTCWLTATTDRFSAAVTGAACSSLESETGTADVGLWLGRWEVGGDPWHDPELFRKHSPQAFVGNVNCPTLILHGETDDRCPVEQGEEWFTALRAREVPVEFVRYPGGSHLFRVDGRPSHRIDFNRRVASWVSEWVGGQAGRPKAKSANFLTGYSSRLETLATALNVPGVSVALLHDGVIETAEAGRLHCERPDKVSADARFQIGSITKVFTTSLIMQLVESGTVDLDTPVVRYVPEFKLADDAATASITVRHLLAHTSGIPGDWFPDLGDDATAQQLVATLAGFDLLHPVGEYFSYSNSAFTLAGRLLEVVTGASWPELLAARLVGPLGLEMAATADPGGGQMVGLAMGHLPADSTNPLNGVVVAPRYATHPEAVACGSTPVATARALATFAQMFISDGRSTGGAEILAPSSVKEMTSRQIDVPASGLDGRRTRGLGWGLAEWDGHQILQHRGGTLGQTSGLTVMPDRGVAVAILTNGPGGFLLCRAVEADLFGEVTGIHPAGPPLPPTEALHLDLDRYRGVYSSVSADLEVEVDGDHLTLVVSEKMALDPTLEPSVTPPIRLTAVDETTFAAPDSSVISFVGDDEGPPQFVFTGRLHRRQS